MPFISINVTGLNEIEGSINQFMRNVPQINKEILDESTDLFVRTAKSKVHVITGKTKNSIRSQGITRNQSIIEARWGAKWEEQRSGSKGALGPHKFLTETTEVVKAQMPSIIRRHYDELIKRF